MSVRSALAVLCLAVGSCAAQELTIAAASDLQFAMPEVVKAFEEQTGKKVRVSFGSSGNLYAQLQNGAPFDLFFSADVTYPQHLQAAGLAKPGSFYVYATGKLALWVPQGGQGKELSLLTGPEIRRIAIANPAHAPYGRAAKQALERAGIWEAVNRKLVMGENISQAAQFVDSGNAQAGIIAVSLLRGSKRTGYVWTIPQELYSPLEQAAVILNSAKNAAAAAQFLAFLKSDAGGAIMQRYGFVAPDAKAKDDK